VSVLVVILAAFGGLVAYELIAHLFSRTLRRYTPMSYEPVIGFLGWTWPISIPLVGLLALVEGLLVLAHYIRRLAHDVKDSL
jgi:hypothetical protein